MLGISQRVMMGVSAGGAGAPEITVNAVNFDGTNDYLLRGGDLTGAADGDFILGSFWIKIGTDGSTYGLYKSALNNKLNIAMNASGKPQVIVGDAAGSSWTGVSNDLIVEASGWVNFLFSFNASTGDRHFFLNDVQVSYLTNVYTPGRGIDWTHTDHAIGSTTAGTTRFDGDLAEFYITDEHLDLSVVSNRRKFISTGGKPVDLGSDGSDPTGTAPLVYLRGPTATWHTNKGSGGGFNENGALTTASSSPSD